MLKEDLKNWIMSEYNEGTDEQLDYYINESECNIGDKAYIYLHEEKRFIEMEIVNIICRTEDMQLYDELIKDKDILINGELEYKADTSAEFITDNNCYLVWFKFTN